MKSIVYFSIILLCFVFTQETHWIGIQPTGGNTNYFRIWIHNPDTLNLTLNFELSGLPECITVTDIVAYEDNWSISSQECDFPCLIQVQAETQSEPFPPSGHVRRWLRVNFEILPDCVPEHSDITIDNFISDAVDLSGDPVELDWVLANGFYCCGEKGDVNWDQHFDVLDIVMLVGYILGNTDLNPCQLWAADITDDWIVNWMDFNPWLPPMPMINILDVVTMINMLMN